MSGVLGSSVEESELTRNLSDFSPFFVHLSHSLSACLKFRALMASWIGRRRRSVTLLSAMAGGAGTCL
jgi:hypothetical protein